MLIKHSWKNIIAINLRPMILTHCYLYKVYISKYLLIQLSSIFVWLSVPDGCMATHCEVDNQSLSVCTCLGSMVLNSEVVCMAFSSFNAFMKSEMWGIPIIMYLLMLCRCVVGVWHRHIFRLNNLFWKAMGIKQKVYIFTRPPFLLIHVYHAYIRVFHGYAKYSTKTSRP